MNEFYRNRSILITGSTGFIGKVLIEKLLHSFIEIKQIYLIIRGSKPNDRFKTSSMERFTKQVLGSPIFRLRNRNQTSTKIEGHQNDGDGIDRKIEFWQKKFTIIDGDLVRPRLGLNDEHYRILSDEISIVFHSAASVQFHGPLRTFLQQNVLGTKEIMDLCRNMKQLKVIVYVSTAYSNCNQSVIEERIYPLIDDDIDLLIEKILSDERSDTVLKHGDPLLMDRPNAYTLSKAIAECLIEQKYSDLPLVICRPSIVAHSYHEPSPGWCDNYNGLAGPFLLSSLGVAQTMKIYCENRANIIPVDFVVNAMILIAYDRGELAERNRIQKYFVRDGIQIPVVHLTLNESNDIDWGQLIRLHQKASKQNPSMKVLRPIASEAISVSSWHGLFQHYLCTLFHHHLMAYLIDFFFVLGGKRRCFCDAIEKLHRSYEVLEFFTNNQWKIKNENYLKILQRIPTDVQREFESDTRKICWNNYSKTIQLGIRRYLLRENDSTLPLARKRLKRLEMYWSLAKQLSFACFFLLFLLLIYFWI